MLLSAQQSGQLQAALVRAYGHSALVSMEPVLERFLSRDLEPQIYRASFEAASIQGAFVASHNLILIDQDLGSVGTRLQAVLVEELGHWLETQAGLADTAGDEGERLAMALVSHGLSQWTTLGADDDHIWLNVADQLLEAELSANHPPTLTTVATITGAAEDSFKEITYADLFAASNAADVDGDALSFRIDAISTGTL